MTARILVVDDEPDARELFRQNFRRDIRKGQYLFDFAPSALAALQILKEQGDPEITLVLSDINMPGMSGTELLAELRHIWPELPVFMITAYGDAATEAKAKALGAERFLTKPVDFVRLRHEVSEVLEAGE